jgi:hypothetical protein
MEGVTQEGVEQIVHSPSPPRNIDQHLSHLTTLTTWRCVRGRMICCAVLIRRMTQGRRCWLESTEQQRHKLSS